MNTTKKNLTPKKKKGRQKHVPQRTCVICRQKFDKRQLTRIVRTADDGVVVDLTGKKNGRGAYLCDQKSCWDRVLTDLKPLNKALMTEITAAEKAQIAAHKPGNEELTERLNDGDKIAD